MGVEDALGPTGGPGRKAKARGRVFRKLAPPLCRGMSRDKRIIIMRLEPIFNYQVDVARCDPRIGHRVEAEPRQPRCHSYALESLKFMSGK